jgi:hypothetical protein
MHCSEQNEQKGKNRWCLLIVHSGFSNIYWQNTTQKAKYWATRIFSSLPSLLCLLSNNTISYGNESFRNNTIVLTRQLKIRLSSSRLRSSLNKAIEAIDELYLIFFKFFLIKQFCLIKQQTRQVLWFIPSLIGLKYFWHFGFGTIKSWL